MSNTTEQTIIKLKHELSDLETYIMELETHCEDEITSLEIELKKSDNKIIDLEYELFLEKTRDSKHKFYWFTAKKRPLHADVSYMSKENHFYGFEQTPNYYFIKLDDLRFITHCSLDDVIEQF